jgi:hypothetical protein
MQLPMMFWPEQAQHLAERYDVWLHLIKLISMRRNVDVKGFWLKGPGFFWFHYVTRSGYATMHLPMMYWPEQAQHLAERYDCWFHLLY